MLIFLNTATCFWLYLWKSFLSAWSRSRDKEEHGRDKERSKKSINDPRSDHSSREHDHNKASGRIHKESGGSLPLTPTHQRIRDGNGPSTPLRSVGQTTAAASYIARHEFLAGDGRTTASPHGRHSGPPNLNDGGSDRWSSGQPRERYLSRKIEKCMNIISFLFSLSPPQYAGKPNLMLNCHSWLFGI